MVQKSTYIIVLVFIFIIGTSSVLSSFTPPAGSTGVTPGVTCSNNGLGCHASFADNSGGGSVTTTGLPTIYTAGAGAMSFSVTVSHGAADRKRWGFSIVAVDGLGNPIGTFNSTNANAAINSNDAAGKELSHFAAPITALSSSYVFDNLTWTPPATDMGPVTFYFAGVAANADGASGLDYVYTSSTISSSLPITLYSFDAVTKNNQVILSWQTAQEINSKYFMIQKSYDNRQFTDIGKVDASGNSSLSKSYNFTDDNPSFFEKPIFYRLLLVDKDGAKIYSRITNVVLKATSTFIKGIYPNPLKAGSLLHVNFVSKESQTVHIKLVDLTGRIVKHDVIVASKGSNILDIQMPEAISSGNYKLTIQSDAGLIQQPLLIH
ncbi:MAG: choice-of-anchor V domain-containing protein [Ginsengibacter sp.]